MTIDATDLSHVIIDGKDQGHLIDAVRNFPLRAAELKGAFDQWLIAHDDQTATIRNAAAQGVLDAQAEKDAAIAAAQAEKDEAIAAMEVLGTKEEAQAMIKQQQVAAIEASIEAQSIKLSELRAAMAKG